MHACVLCRVLCCACINAQQEPPSKTARAPKYLYLGALAVLLGGSCCAFMHAQHNTRHKTHACIHDYMGALVLDTITWGLLLLYLLGGSLVVHFMHNMT